jgi:hypothetical protein
VGLLWVFFCLLPFVFRCSLTSCLDAFLVVIGGVYVDTIAAGRAEFS